MSKSSWSKFWVVVTVLFTIGAHGEVKHSGKVAGEKQESTARKVEVPSSDDLLGAILEKDYVKAKTLLGRGANINGKARDVDPITFRVTHLTPIAQIVIEKALFELNSGDGIQMLEFMLENGFNPNEGLTSISGGPLSNTIFSTINPLFLVAAQHNPTRFDKPADPLIDNEERVKERTDKIIRLLVEHGAKVTDIADSLKNSPSSFSLSTRTRRYLIEQSEKERAAK